MRTRARAGGWTRGRRIQAAGAGIRAGINACCCRRRRRVCVRVQVHKSSYARPRGGVGGCGRRRGEAGRWGWLGARRAMRDAAAAGAGEDDERSMKRMA